MADDLATIRKVIAAHHAVRRDVKSVGDSVSDLEALFSLQQSQSGWAQGSIETLSKKREQLMQTIRLLGDGLKNHFAQEEKLLPPLFGEGLMKALLLEHRDIRKKLEEAEAMLTSTTLEGLSQEELLYKKARFQQMISNTCQMVEEHAGHEELILRMLERGLAA
ncbi:MAG: hypothetical protein A2Y91_01875 [Chloroflexi bacterium RBG_13_54_8]|nr:MAG: hypothetical protein A2Y91_01875 [Chloroflexi bacterium RBG_13_54_8]